MTGNSNMGMEGETYTLSSFTIDVSKCKYKSVYCDKDDAGNKWGYWLGFPAPGENSSWIWAMENELGRLTTANTRRYQSGNTIRIAWDNLGFRPVVALDSSVVFNESVNGTYQMN